MKLIIAIKTTSPINV